MNRVLMKYTAKTMIDKANGNKLFVRVDFQHREVEVVPGIPFELTDEHTMYIIYRREITNYLHSRCEEEFFSGLAPTKDDIIFSGKLLPEYSFFHYDDYDVEHGKVYVYWVARMAAPDAFIGPYAVKVRDEIRWMRYDTILEKTEEFKKHDGVEVVRVGTTVQSRPLYAILAGNRNNMIACFGAVHAGEAGPEILLNALENLLTNRPDLFKNAGIAILPSVNADMREEMATGKPRYIRKNANGVDLNRNLDANWENPDYMYGLSSMVPKSPTYRGPYADSEPEVRAVQALIEMVKPKAVFNYHAMSGMTGDQMLSAKSGVGNTEYENKLLKFIELYHVGFRKGAPNEGDKDVRLFPDCSYGSIPEWCYLRGIPSFDLEVGGRKGYYWAEGAYDNVTPELMELCIKQHTSALYNVLENMGK